MREDDVVERDDFAGEVAADDTVGTGKYEKLINDGANRYKLTGMYKDWDLQQL